MLHIYNLAPDRDDYARVGGHGIDLVASPISRSGRIGERPALVTRE